MYIQWEMFELLLTKSSFRGSRIDIFHPSPCSISVHSTEQMILEVKFDDFLPMAVRKILSQQLIGPQTISKYYLCRQHIHSWENGQ